MTRHRTADGEQVRQISVPDTVRLGGALFVPWRTSGLVRRRSRLAALAVRFGTDRRAVRLLARLRRRYGPGPLRIPWRGQRMVLLLSREDVRRILADSPEELFTSPQFLPADTVARKVPARFQPHGVPVPPGENRGERRRADETALDTYQQVHGSAGPYIVRVYQEARALLDGISAEGVLTWDDFTATYERVTRRIVLGDSARDDRMLTDLLVRLGRARRPWREGGRDVARDTYLRRLRMYIERAEPESLARLLAQTSPGSSVEPMYQVTRWLAGFGAAGIVAYRALALLAAHPDRLRRARADLAGLPGESLPSPVATPYLGACVLESARLWPPTRVILRESAVGTRWHGRVVPAGTVFVVVVPFFGRDRAALDYADRFLPEVWLDDRAATDGAIVPFGGGTGRCAGENLAMLVASTFLGALVRGHEIRLLDPKRLRRSGRPVPYGLDPFAVRLGFRPLPQR
ncbi:Cytochrome P450 [Thermomonospora echinospora]|uniref:Cytochrome P450 n=1 Tax=Thermomonospora echinospora TaxID=1992 RepID=A0A1H5TKM3_9ACTN|nr:cytochrome P450 [Thermomonospora echinospora]SEF63313.1 Cytochrome P450 [Thermomonospora echinospora]